MKGGGPESLLPACLAAAAEGVFAGGQAHILAWLLQAPPRSHRPSAADAETAVAAGQVELLERVLLPLLQPVYTPEEEEQQQQQQQQEEQEQWRQQCPSGEGVRGSAGYESGAGFEDESEGARQPRRQPVLAAARRHHGCPRWRTSACEALCEFSFWRMQLWARGAAVVGGAGGARQGGGGGRGRGAPASGAACVHVANGPPELMATVAAELQQGHQPQQLQERGAARPTAVADGTDGTDGGTAATPAALSVVQANLWAAAQRALAKVAAVRFQQSSVSTAGGGGARFHAAVATWH
ncbi:hypothetical protein HYH02_010652 [Chlamydomonas schloesseri]|uniref:Uncharacterized protein n=1 Tax=Chlamydomonas schloesseri TaxID=2026947 RepID=A0A835TL89_9CHLO|nr:hypothetical protein HYH02_010652 [Chlamydomonas schloesseri]|eukprot:KAG2439775.1 hypothetical protein HYH02_010652 [Chlamydomonas schloesseri]